MWHEVAYISIGQKTAVEEIWAAEAGTWGERWLGREGEVGEGLTESDPESYMILLLLLIIIIITYCQGEANSHRKYQDNSSQISPGHLGESQFM